jgi:hypothetical protein
MAEKRGRTTGINYFIDDLARKAVTEIKTMVKLIRSKELQFTCNPKPNGYFKCANTIATKKHNML